jgi:enoyl-CoA hydratase
MRRYWMPAALASELPDAVVIVGRDGFFSAGLDLNVVPTLDAAGQAGMIMGINRMVAAWYGFERPVVGAINGHAIAGGIVLALCADYRVGSTKGPASRRKYCRTSSIAT